MRLKVSGQGRNNMSETEKNILKKIGNFKKKYYLNLVIKGIILSLSLIISAFIAINTLEYSFRLISLVRATLLFSFIGLSGYFLIKLIIVPLYRMGRPNSMNDLQAAQKIGKYFPEVDDRLLNIIQLKNDKLFSDALKLASIRQTSKNIAHIDFSEAIKISENKQYLKYLGIPLAVMILILVFSPSFFTNSTERIIRFDEEFVPKAPFTFNLGNNDLLAFKNEDYTLSIKLKGTAIPETAYLLNNDRKMKMTKKEAGLFTYTFPKIQNDKNIRFEAAGFNSPEYNITVVDRPILKNFNVYLNYPAYLGKDSDVLENTGNLQIPAGTKVKWQLHTLETKKASIAFHKDSTVIDLQRSDNHNFEFEKSFYENETYSLTLNNRYSNNKDKIFYAIDVIPDEYPSISVTAFQDTTLFGFIALGGEVADDHGLTALKLYYSTNNGDRYISQNIPIENSQPSQRYYYHWTVDSLGLSKGTSIEYYLQVWDNDGIRGHKSSKTGIYEFKIPTDQEVKEDIQKSSSLAEENMDKTIKKAKELKNKLENTERKLRGKKEVSWQDENTLKDILEKREELNAAIEELKKQNAELNAKRARFTQQDQEIKKKVEQLQQLMDDLLDEETKKLYDELKKLLEENKDVNQIQEMLNRLNNKEDNLEKELERTLELFKRMKFEQNLNKSINELEHQVSEQENLMNKTLDNEKNIDQNKDRKLNNGELDSKQEELKEKFEYFEKELEKLKEENQELKNPKSLPDTEEEQQNIKQQQDLSQQHLQKNNRNKSGKSQQKAAEEMKKMAGKMQQMQSSMQMQMMQENIDDLRDIVHNLVKLSFDQESLMNEFAGVKQSDPRFVGLSQKQLKIGDDAQIVEDSLLSLAKRVFQISSFVTRGVNDMNIHMDKSVLAIKERKKPIAVSEQQFAMTSMNNLALLLDDVLQQMLQAMSDAMGQGQEGQQKEEGSPSLNELQQQLNDQIEGLKKSGKSGRELSEELAQLAAKQERIRKAMQEMQQKYGNGEKGDLPGKGLPEKMEQTELDLVNKQLTEETIKRQKEIITRLLEAENALRQREFDEERKGETAKDYEKQLPKAFEEYFKLKEKEIELLKTVPPKLFPYYKKEISEYFKRLEQNQQK